MTFHLPVNTWIIPFDSQGNTLGTPYYSSVALDFTEEDILEKLDLEILPGEGVRPYFRLSLGENPTKFDSYLVEVDEVSEV